MTKEEHQLLLMMFARQMEYITVLENVLKREGLIQSDDLPAFEAAVLSDLPARALTFQNAVEQYKKFADEVGIPLDID